MDRKKLEELLSEDLSVSQKVSYLLEIRQSTVGMSQQAGVAEPVSPVVPPEITAGAKMVEEFITELSSELSKTSYFLGTVRKVKHPDLEYGDSYLLAGGRKFAEKFYDAYVIFGMTGENGPDVLPDPVLFLGLKEKGKREGYQYRIVFDSDIISKGRPGKIRLLVASVEDDIIGAIEHLLNQTNSHIRLSQDNFSGTDVYIDYGVIPKNVPGVSWT